MAYNTAHFKTAYKQREVVLDTKVKDDLTVGALCKRGDTGLEGVETVADAEFIVAQSDTTLGYGHIPVELRDFKYNPAVAKSSTEKKVAVFRIINPDDIILDVKA